VEHTTATSPARGPGVRPHPHDGYVGIGRVLEGPVPISDFTIKDDGQLRPLLDIPLRNDNIKNNATDPEHAEFLSGPNGNGLYQLAKGYGQALFLKTGNRSRAAGPRDIPQALRPGPACHSQKTS
jgi:hypothetical protein